MDQRIAAITYHAPSGIRCRREVVGEYWGKGTRHSVADSGSPRKELDERATNGTVFGTNDIGYIPLLLKGTSFGPTPGPIPFPVPVPVRPQSRSQSRS